MAAAIRARLALARQARSAARSWLLPASRPLLLVGLLFASPRDLEGAAPSPPAPGAVPDRPGQRSEHRSRSCCSPTTCSITVSANGRRPDLRRGADLASPTCCSSACGTGSSIAVAPAKRAAGCDGPPDFLFPQMTDDRVAPADWRPELIDYLYVSLTNAPPSARPTRCRCHARPSSIWRSRRSSRW